MQKIILLFICLCSFVILSLTAEIHEVMHINELLSYVKKDMLILLDIDNTLIEPVQDIGCESWFDAVRENNLKDGDSPKEAFEKAMDQWQKIQWITKVKAVEKNNHKIITTLQKKNFAVMGLTTRGFNVTYPTIKQLQSIRINLMATAPSKGTVFFSNPLPVLFHKGILFTDGTHKGKALFKFLKSLDYHPESILFINDNIKHIQQIEETCNKKNVSFIGLRYGYLDEKVKNFNKKLARIHVDEFCKVLNNRQAQNLCQGRVHVKKHLAKQQRHQQ